MTSSKHSGATGGESDRLRAAILSHPAEPARALAARLGCSKSLVYKVRCDPGADGRHRGRTAQRATARVRDALAAAAEPQAIDDLGDQLTTFRARRPVQAPGEPLPGDPYAALLLASYEAARGADAGSLAPEITLLRSRIRETAGQLTAFDLPADEVLELQEHLADLAATLARLVRAHAATATGVGPWAQAFASVADEVLDGGPA